jgi:hypothetical protein
MNQFTIRWRSTGFKESLRVVCLSSHDDNPAERLRTGPIWGSRTSSTRCVIPSWRLIASRTSGDVEIALVRRGYLHRSGGALPHASGGVPPNGSDHGEPRQRGLAGTCCGVDEVGEGARRRCKAALISTPGSGSSQIDTGSRRQSTPIQKPTTPVAIADMTIFAMSIVSRQGMRFAGLVMGRTSL